MQSDLLEHYVVLQGKLASVRAEHGTGSEHETPLLAEMDQIMNVLTEGFASAVDHMIPRKLPDDGVAHSMYQRPSVPDGVLQYGVSYASAYGATALNPGMPRSPTPHVFNRPALVDEQHAKVFDWHNSRKGTSTRFATVDGPMGPDTSGLTWRHVLGYMVAAPLIAVGGVLVELGDWIASAAESRKDSQ